MFSKKQEKSLKERTEGVKSVFSNMLTEITSIKEAAKVENDINQAQIEQIQKTIETNNTIILENDAFAKKLSDLISK